MKTMLPSRKTLIISAVIVFVAVGGTWLWVKHHQRSHHCISYYGKDGKQLLYQDCK